MITIACDTTEQKTIIMEMLDNSDICIFSPTGLKHFYCDKFCSCLECIKANIKFIVEENKDE